MEIKETIDLDIISDIIRGRVEDEFYSLTINNAKHFPHIEDSIIVSYSVIIDTYDGYVDMRHSTDYIPNCEYIREVRKRKLLEIKNGFRKK